LKNDTTAIRISGYFALVWLMAGNTLLLHHFKAMSGFNLALGGTATLLTILGFVFIAFTDKMAVKLIAEPLTAIGVLIAATGLFFAPMAWLGLLLGVIVLSVFGASLHEHAVYTRKNK
jgi:hypothetical protein